MDTNILNDLAKQIADLRSEEAEASRAKKEVTARLEAVETKMLECLTEAGLDYYKSPFGTPSISYFTSVKTPKTPEDIAALAEYTKGIGEYDNVFKPGSAAVNSFYKQQLELALAKGNTEFKIPGLNDVTIEPRLNFRKG